MNIEFIKAAGVRALKTCCQTAIATIGTTALMTEVDWLVVLSASGLAGVLSILTSLAGLPEVKKDAL
ncbi:MAG: holin [Acetobacterium sp.]|uniref:holin n=1 Tax=Acetobacterium sp. TaxID=1872094 RepID=UPI00324285CF